MEVLIGKNKKLFKANLHCHSTKSDGRASVERLKEEYMKRGYSIIAFTDHDAVHSNAHLTDGDFLAITSAELSVKEDATQSTHFAHKMKCAHLNFYALEENNLVTPCYNSLFDKYKNEWSGEVIHEGEYERVYSPECINDMIRIGHERGFLISLNHPSWSLQDASDYLKYEGLDFIEIVNGSCVNCGHDDDEHVLDEIVRSGRHIFCTAADDNHNADGFEGPKADSFLGFTMIDSPSLEYCAVMTALKNGDFYASEGPIIHSLTRDGKKVNVKCSEADRIFMSTDSRIRRRKLTREGESLTEATFELSEGYDYFRIVVVDKRGKKAFSQFYRVAVD